MDFMSCTQGLAPVPCLLAPTAADRRRMGAAEGLLTFTLKAKAVCVEKKKQNKQPFSFSQFRCFQHLKLFTYSSLQVQLFLHTCECTHIHTYRVGKAEGKNKKVLEVTAVRHQKWVRSEELCLVSISDHRGPSEELFAYCPNTWTIFI